MAMQQRYSSLVLGMRSRRTADEQCRMIRFFVLPDVEWLEAANRTHGNHERAALAAQAVTKLTEATDLLSQIAGEMRSND